MKNSEKTRDIWYQLDNAANLFPSISGNSNTNVFRLTCALREPVDPGRLQAALEAAIDSFPYFEVVMRRGLFWFYLERTNLRPVAEPESGRPCGRIFYKHIKELLFRVTYFQNNINLEVFHAISDGTGAFDFLRAILYSYLVSAHRDSLPEELPILDREPPPVQQAEDSFNRYYTPDKTKSPFKQRAFTIGGTLLPNESIRIITATLPTSQMLALAKSKGVTITAYLTSLMILSVYQELMPKRAIERTVSVTVPVDLRGHFTSETSRNFFSVMDIGYNFSKGGDSFEEVLAHVTRKLQEKTNPQVLARAFGYTMSVQKNPFSRFTPLVLKNHILKAAYVKRERATTCALSNLGRITMPEPFVPYIDHFSCLLNPTHLHRWKACICSFEDALVISFTSCIAETRAHKAFIRHLSAQGLDICVTCNGGADDEIL